MALAQTTNRLGSYLLGERLGLGGMAEVFAAESPEHGRVALKRILPSLTEERDFADMFWDEARVTSRLDHPNVIRILDYGRVNGQLFMALEYVDGPAVSRVLRKAARAKQHLDLRAVLSIGRQLLSGLHFVHSARDDKGTPLSIVHRDVSPGNILLSTHGEVKLGDFGIVRSDIVLRRTQPGELKGKIGYMSPEQVQGRTLDARSDVFSVGVVLAELLILRPLLLGKSEMQTLNRTSKADLTTWQRFNEHVPYPVRSLVEKALRKDPAERFQSAEEMRHAINNVAVVSGFELGREAVRDLLTKLDMLDDRVTVKFQSGERPLKSQQARVLPPSGEHEKAELLGPFPQPTGRPLWKMSFDTRSLPRQLMMALRRTWDGVVLLSAEQRTLSLELRGGRMVASHDSSGEGLLGERLVQESRLTENDLRGALFASEAAGLRLGEYLVFNKMVRESILRRTLDEQMRSRLASWIGRKQGTFAVYLSNSTDASASERLSFDGPFGSVQQLVMVLREVMDYQMLRQQLGSVLSSGLLPAPGADPSELGLTPPENRALVSVLEGGACEGRIVEEVIETLANERIARPRESAFAVLVGLCAGQVYAPGF